MSYTLKFFETPLVEFDMVSTDDNFRVDVLFCKWNKADMLPLSMRVLHGSQESLEKELAKWLEARVMHPERTHMREVFESLGLAEHDIAGAVAVSRCLSLNDAYWVVPTDSTASFADMNLYTNELNSEIAQISLTGEGKDLRDSLEDGFTLAPEFTTSGQLPKCWKREGEDIVLYKAGSVADGVVGQEPYAEYYASDLARQLGYEAIQYDLKMVDGQLCSTCKMLTNEKIAYASAEQLIKEPGLDAAMRYFFGQAEVTGYADIMDAFADMIVFDALVCNTDRHFGNFGIMLDSHANQPIAAAPLYGNGKALLSGATETDFEDINAYVSQLKPQMYDDFMAPAIRFLGPLQREKLQGALDFTFTRHPEFNWPEWRLTALEEFIHERARMMLSAK